MWLRRKLCSNDIGHKFRIERRRPAVRLAFFPLTRSTKYHTRQNRDAEIGKGRCSSLELRNGGVGAVVNLALAALLSDNRVILHVAFYRMNLLDSVNWTWGLP